MMAGSQVEACFAANCLESRIVSCLPLIMESFTRSIAARRIPGGLFLGKLCGFGSLCSLLGALAIVAVAASLLLGC